MASKINADEFVDREGEGNPTLPKGVVLSGVTTITTATVADNEIANSTGINAGIITSTHFKGNLTGDVNAGIVTVTSQTVVGSAVTISASGIDIGAGVITATSYAGAWGGTGIGATIMVWEYNPDPGDMMVPFASGIGITFNQKIKAGSGNITLREDSSSGTVVENFGIGSSVTIAGNELSFTPTSDLSENKIYHLSYPSGVITNMAGESYVGTAYTFKSLAYDYQLWVWGQNNEAQLGLNDTNKRSSPVQVPGTTWSTTFSIPHSIKTDGTLWGWGNNNLGQLGLNNKTQYSSPVQVGSDTTWKQVNGGFSSLSTMAVKTDGTLWGWGSGANGYLAQNNLTQYSSPVQVPGTTWAMVTSLNYGNIGTKTDGTAWSWGFNVAGVLGQNSQTQYSSPIQIPGTTWSTDYRDWRGGETYAVLTTKTDGTLWGWGRNQLGGLGQNNTTYYSSPVQIPGTTWANTAGGYYGFSAATKTDGTLWAWGVNSQGQLGQNQPTNSHRSSPVQIPGTTWNTISGGVYSFVATKTDGTLWSWGYDGYGESGQNAVGGPATRSSPTQIPGTDWVAADRGKQYVTKAVKQI